MADSHPTAADRMSDSSSSYETSEVPVPRFTARVRRDEGLSDGEVRSYRADGASFRGIDPEGGPRLRIPAGYLEGDLFRKITVFFFFWVLITCDQQVVVVVEPA